MAARVLLVLAIVAALLGAPSTAFAAGNELHDARAEPTTGTVATLFVLSVSYDGNFPAVSVRASVAGLDLPMSLVSGTPTRGTWRTAVSLPVGSWPVAFSATSERGNDPSLAGPTLHVLGAAPATSPTVTSDPRSQPDSQMEGFDDLSPPPAAAPAPAEATTAPEPPAQGEEAPAEQPTTTQPSPPPPNAPEAPAGSSSPAETPTGAARSPGSAGSDTQRPPGPTDDTPAARAAESRPGARGASGTAPREAQLAATTGPVPSAEPASSITTLPAVEASIRVTAVWAAVLLAFAAVFLGVLLRRRRGGGGEADALATAERTDAILRRRALRRARVVLPEDPIVASMGLPDVDPRHPRTPRTKPHGSRDDDPP
jgi:hypothetical protein